MIQFDSRIDDSIAQDSRAQPILICLLGDFLLLKAGQPVAVRSGGKAEGLLCLLGLQRGGRVSRDLIVSALWSNVEPALANQSLNSLVYSLNKLLGEALGNVPPVVHADGYYWLNVEAGVGVDVSCFEALVDAGDQQERDGQQAAAARSYRRAVQLYRGDLSAGTDMYALMEREHLRTRYLRALAQLADYHYTRGDYAACLDYTRRLLACDPCREDAHRAAMCCYVRQGERAQALRQYRFCADILRAEFDTAPEPATVALYDQVRLDPGGI